MVKIAPSILSADFSRLGEEVLQAINAGADVIHVDVMDRHFVPNLTIGPLVVSALRPIAREHAIPLDVHLMVENPEWMLEDFIQAGADILTVHVEACVHLHRVVQNIKELGAKAGVAINPATPLVMLEEILTDIDLVLVLSVNPGFGGQSYIPGSNRRITQLRAMLNELGLSRVELEVDGGIKPENAAEVVSAGASVLVAGSAIFNDQRSVGENLAALRQAAR
jgi:ribulose-phosphate 3-epimerase